MPNETDTKMKAQGVHSENPAREDGEWRRIEGTKRKAEASEEESRLRKTVVFLKTYEMIEAKKESRKAQPVMEVVKMDANVEDTEERRRRQNILETWKRSCNSWKFSKDA